ncbi:MAG: exosortase/archaeosortase family protein [Verrucomicrobia bacterium]|nr:exosortase/archaeosortase family protein [Verrucomicrobiota bacterium]MDA1065945.1 exosortase/archaeosortase family protein [Verrucomicrobiota bacterium]
MSLLDRYIPGFKGFPSLFSYTLLMGCGFGAFVAWDQWYWWGRREDYSFGYLVPIFVGVVIWDRWPVLKTLLGVPSSKLTPDLESADQKSEEKPINLPNLYNWATSSLYPFLKWFVPGGFYGGLILGLAIFGLGAFYRAGAGPSHPGSLFIAVGAGMVVFALVYINLPDSVEAWKDQIGQPLEAPDMMNRRLTITLMFWFPCFIWIISAPLVSAIENALSLFLLNKVVTVVFFVFEMGGYALEQEGNTLILPTGRVGVEDACSGIRSLMGCLFAGTFLGAIFFRSTVKKVLLVVFAMCFAFVTNLMRSVFLTAWAYTYGPDAISGFVHDVAGYFVLGLTSIMLLLLIPIMNIQIAVGSGKEH